MQMKQTNLADRINRSLIDSKLKLHITWQLLLISIRLLKRLRKEPPPRDKEAEVADH